MVALLLVVACVPFGRAEEPERMVSVGREYLRQVGASDPLELTSLDHLQGGVPTWQERFTDGKSERYELMLSPNGRIRLVRRAGGSTSLNPQSPMSQAALDRRVGEILYPVVQGEEVGSPSYSMNRAGEVSAWVPRRAAGRPIFNHDGYSVSFKAGSGQFDSLEGPFVEPIRLVNATEPRISEAAAAGLAASYFEKEVLPRMDRGRRMQGMSVSPSGFLGYYSSGADLLQLVWLFGVSPVVGRPRITVMVDALTGQLIHPQGSVELPEKTGTLTLYEPQRAAAPTGITQRPARREGLSSDQAIAIARETLSKVGVTSDLHLGGLQRAVDWNVTFRVTEDSGYFVTIDAQSGATLAISATSQMFPSRIADPRTPESEKLAFKLLRTLVPEGPVAPPQIGWGEGGAGATFLSLAKGRPFFNLNPTYSYSILYWPERGQLLNFTPCPELPEVNATEPVVPGRVAGRKLNAYGKAHISDDGIAQSLYDPQFGGGRLQPQLGYYKFEGEDRARLVWQGVAIQRAGKKEWESGALRMYVDALTGEMIAPDDPGMG